MMDCIFQQTFITKQSGVDQSVKLGVPVHKVLTMTGSETSNFVIKLIFIK